MTPDEFEELLLFLATTPDGTGVPDRDHGAERYEKIRQRIVRIYQAREGICNRAEEVADKALERCGKKAKKLRQRYKGDPALYVYAIAKRVYKEILREQNVPPPSPPPKNDSDEVELRHAWLEHCLQLLKPQSRELVLCFYKGEKREKIENRKRMAAELGISSRALSLRILHIRRKLFECVKGYRLGNLPLK